MSKFETIQDLNKAFLNGSFRFDPILEVEGTIWSMFEVNQVKITESLLNNKSPMIVYTNDKNDNLLVCAWTTNSRNGVVPAGAVVVREEGHKTIVKDTQSLIIEMNGEKITVRPDQLVGDIVRVNFTNLSAPKEIQGKVDTGATISSLHADRYTIKGNQIEFTCNPLTNNVITMPLKTQHAVKSPDGGTVYRPVIELDVKINGKLVQGAMFNLNDRSHMDQPVLIGQNVLQAGKFYVDPSRKESVERVNWEDLQLLGEVVPVITKNPNADIVNELYQKMIDSDVTFNDLIRHIRTEVIKTFDDVE